MHQLPPPRLPPPCPRCRVIQPQTVGGWHLALVYLLVWLGAFLGTYLGGAYMADASTYFESYGLDKPRTLYWKVRGAGWRFAGMPGAGSWEGVVLMPGHERSACCPDLIAQLHKRSRQQQCTLRTTA
jgi:hypothetical protein